MKLTSDSASKLEAICQDLLANKSLVYGGNEVDCETLAKNFIQMLKSEENSAGKEQKITEFYNGYKGISGEENTESDNNAVNGESASGMTTQGSIVNGPKIVGKIDLNGTDRKPKRRFGIPAQSVGTSEQPAGTAEQTAEIEVKTFPTEPGSYIYYSPGTAPKGLLTNITNILLRFEKKVEDDYAAGALYLKDTKITSEPRWMHRPSAGYNITVEDLKKEIRQTNATHKYRGKYNYHRYNNINSSNINEVVEAINSDERFLKLFTLHAAGRLIDRFVDLDNNEVSIKEQASNLIDKLEEVIRKAIRQGGIIVEPSEDSKHGGNYRKYLAPILRIPTEFFINDQESAKIFGTNELQIDLCEYQPVSNYYRTKNKQALICTIYSKGI